MRTNFKICGFNLRTLKILFLSQHPLNLFGQRLAASASNNILFHQNMHQNANFNGFGGLLPPAIFPYGLPTMAFPPQYSGHSIAQLHGIG